MKKRTAAFTLVELLVVIAVISVLAAMLLPSLENAMRSTRRIYCMNNLRQWGFCIQQYATDHNSKLPPYRQANYYPTFNHHPFTYGLMDADNSTVFSRSLAAYGGERNHCATQSLWTCPDTPSQPIYYFMGNSYNATYGYMGYRGNSDQHIWRNSRITDVRVNNRKSILMADSMYMSSATGWVAMYNHGNAFEPATAAWSQLHGVAYRPVGVNVCYIDNSVTWLDWANLDTSVYYSGYDSRSYYWTE